MKKTNHVLKALQACLCLFLLLLFFPFAHGQTLPANFQRVTITSSLSNPTAMAFTPDGRTLVCQQGGQLRVVKNGSLLTTPAVSLSVNTDGERGLIGVAVDPNFASNQFIYLYYTHTSGPHNRVSRFTMTGDVAGSEQAILDMPTLGGIFHNGGGMVFGNDGKLYVAVGENQVGSNSQNLDNYFGKLLRINSDGTVPAGNPFTGNAARSRIWAYGLRNPFTIASDAVSGKLFVNDVGNATWEEINDATTSGRNFGWPDKEGMCTSGCTGFTNPVYVYATNRSDPPPNGQGCAINGGTFFNGAISNYPAVYNGKYFFLDYCGAWIDYINPTSPSRVSFATGLTGDLVYIKQGTDGNLYYLRRGNNTLYRIVYNGSQSPVITAQPQSISVPQGQTANFSVTASGTPAPTYQWRKNGTNISGATATTYSITNVQPSHAGQYSVVVSNSAGSVTSNNATLTVTQPNTLPVATISSPTNGALFRSGDVITVSGTATDAEDGTLPGSAFEWYVDFHHATHIHPGPSITDGVTSSSFTVNLSGHNETNIWYRIYLVVQDSQGGRDTSFVEIFPVTSTLTLQTAPAGLQVRLDDVPFTAPYTTEAVSGATRPIAAITPQTVNGVTYIFDHWSQGGAAAQNITITDNDATYTAHYRVAPTPVNITPLHDAYVRDGTNAAITHGTTDSTLLITKLSPSGQLNNAREAYLMFDLASVSGNVESIVLKVYGKVDLTTVPTVPVGVFSVANTTWTENTITWNNKPATSASELAIAAVSNTAFAYYNWDVTNYVKSELLAGRTRVAFAMKSLQAHDPRIFWNSSEFGSNPPLLSVIAENGEPPCEPVIASADDGNVAANVLDNNLSTRWSANGDGQWIQFCLTDTLSVNGVQIAFYNGNTRTSTFDVLTGNDGNNFTTAASGLVSSGTSLNLETFSFTARQAKYVRIVGHGNSVNLWNSYTEVKINTGSTPGQQFTLAPQHDAYVRDGASATITHGTTDAATLVTKLNPTSTAGNNRHTYIRFDASPVGGAISSAVLRVYGGLSDNRSTNIPVAVYAVSNTTWTESAITWNNKPATGTLLQSATVTDSIGRYYTWDITSYVQAEKAAGRNIISLALICTGSSTPVLNWNSKETGSNPPQLVVNTAGSLLTQRTGVQRLNIKLVETGIKTLNSYPNPFRENNTISFMLDKSGYTNLAVYDMAGKQVAILINGRLQAGYHQTSFTPGNIPAGMYVLKLVHNGKLITRKMIRE